MTFRGIAAALALLLVLLAVGWVVFTNPNCDRSHANLVFCPSDRD